MSDDSNERGSNGGSTDVPEGDPGPIIRNIEEASIDLEKGLSGTRTRRVNDAAPIPPTTTDPDASNQGGDQNDGD